VSPIRVADLLAEDERMPVDVHVIDHPDERVLVDTGMTELHAAAPGKQVCHHPTLGGAAVGQTPIPNEQLPEWLRPRGSMLSECPMPGCTTLTMGGTCVAHDPPATVTYTRGRPFVAVAVELDSVAVPR
jgi:hypothetical protein